MPAAKELNFSTAQISGTNNFKNAKVIHKRKGQAELSCMPQFIAVLITFIAA